MYVDKLVLKNIRTFNARKEIRFVHPECEYSSESEMSATKPGIANVNLLLGDNGSGKTTILQALALAAFGPAVIQANLGARDLVRINDPKRGGEIGEISTIFRMHEQDNSQHKALGSKLAIRRRGELEEINFKTTDHPELWDRVFDSKNDAYFIVAYGATRRVEPGESLDMGARTKSRFLRAQRVQGIFHDSYSLIPLTYWLPSLRESNPGRYIQVVRLINKILEPGHFKLTEILKNGDYLFERGNIPIPFQSLSDGYRAFVGWIADLLYHICFGCPNCKNLVENQGIVLVDEVDLHLHPKWQMTVIETLSKALPKMQFILTSHSPLIAGSLQRSNVIRLERYGNQTSVQRVTDNIYGLDADQILLTDLFGLTSTRARYKRNELEELRLKARSGDRTAAKKLIDAMTNGLD